MSGHSFVSGRLSQTKRASNIGSAALADAERQIKLLQDENSKLREELADVKSLYIQLTKESQHEKFDERRVTLLKAQLIQLERQLLLLNDALGARMCIVLEAENTFQGIVERCNNVKTQEEKIGGYFISKEQLNGIEEVAESARVKLFKNLENTSMQRLHKPIQFLNTYVKHGDWNKATLLDICSGELNHINLKQVGKLESSLSQIYSQLQRVNHCLTAHLFPDESSHVSFMLPQANHVRMLGECSKACNMLNKLLPDLLELSVLVPAAPWPNLTKPIIKELTVDHVMNKMPTMTKTKSQEVSDVVSMVLKVLSLIQLKANIQEKTYRDEIKFHRSVYELQLDYIQDLFKALRLGFEQLETETNELICRPLEKVLNIYQSLKKTAAEEALRKFLAAFKEQEPQMCMAVAKLRKEEAFKGQDEALSSFSRDFFMKLEELQRKCQEEREEHIEQLQKIKEQQKEYWSEIRLMMQDGYLDENEQDRNSSFATTDRNKAMEKTSLHDKGWNSSVDVYRDDESLHEQEPVSSQSMHTQRDSFITPEPLPHQKPRRKKSEPKNTSFKSNISPKQHNPHEESEALFRSMLRGDIHDGPGFVFDTSAVNDSELLEQTHQRQGPESKPPKRPGRIMKGVPHSKLVLKPIPRDTTVRSRSATPDNSRRDSGGRL